MVKIKLTKSIQKHTGAQRYVGVGSDAGVVAGHRWCDRGYVQQLGLLRCHGLRVDLGTGSRTVGDTQIQYSHLNWLLAKGMLNCRYTREQ